MFKRYISENKKYFRRPMSSESQVKIKKNREVINNAETKM